MYSENYDEATLRYLEEFKELQELLQKGLARDPENDTVRRLLTLTRNGFVFTLDATTTISKLRLENQLLTEELRHKKVELLNKQFKNL